MLLPVQGFDDTGKVLVIIADGIGSGGTAAPVIDDSGVDAFSAQGLGTFNVLFIPVSDVCDLMGFNVEFFCSSFKNL